MLCSLCQTLIVFVLRRARLLFNPFHWRCDDGNGFSSSIVQTVEIPASALAEQTVSHAVFASEPFGIQSPSDISFNQACRDVPQRDV